MSDGPLVYAHLGRPFEGYGCRVGDCRYLAHDLDQLRLHHDVHHPGEALRYDYPVQKPRHVPRGRPRTRSA